jgi:hypothetical protein
MERVAGLTCQPPPRVLQNLTLHNGDVLVGRVQESAIHLTIADGSATPVPLGQISQLSVHEDAPTTAPSLPAGTLAIIYSLHDEHLAVTAPAAIEFRSRWGLLTISPGQIREIVFCAKNQAAHRLVLSDGSVLTGIVPADTLSMTPRQFPEAAIAVPVGEMAKLEFPESPAPVPGSRLEMIGGDVLRGQLQGTLALQTEFPEPPLSAADIVKLAAIPESSGDLEVTMADRSVHRGAPPEGQVACQLDCGLALTVPAAMIAGYTKDAPAAPIGGLGADDPPADSGGLADISPAILQLVSQLASGNPAVRQAAQGRLVNLGNAAIKPLQQIRPQMPQNVKNQINQVIQRIRANAG